MAEPFKNQLGESRIRIIASHLKRIHKAFPESEFLDDALDNLDDLSLMERSRQIVQCFERYLPNEFTQASDILLKAMSPEDKQEDEHGIHSWLAVPVAEFLGKNGLHEFDVAMDALARVTPYFSSEWGIRYLLDHHQDKSLELLTQWCEHPHEHVRRLVSEGSRPRLPWGFQLKAFIQDPTLTYPLLEKLRDDESDYVRLSVANHLNDISKDHPDWLQQQLVGWMDLDNPQRMKLIRHACRTLIKQGHEPTLKMLGYDRFDVENVHLSLIDESVRYGDGLNFELSFCGPKGQPMILDYAIHFKKSDGTLSPKVFKWKATDLPKSGNFKGKKKHVIKPITTRRYYNGNHELEILLNGVSIAKQPFELTGVE